MQTTCLINFTGCEGETMSGQERRDQRTAAASGNGIVDRSGLSWRKSSYSNHQSACVELAGIDRESIAFRDSKDPDGPILIFTRSEAMAFMAFIDQVTAGRITD